MLNFGFKNSYEKTIIKLDSYKENFILKNQDLIIKKIDNIYLILHNKSKASGFGINKYTAYNNLISSSKFINWYNLEISKIMGLEIPNIKYWYKYTQNIEFKIEFNNKWIKLDQNFYCNLYKILNI